VLASQIDVGPSVLPAQNGESYEKEGGAECQIKNVCDALIKGRKKTKWRGRGGEEED